jgi:hypothetical protein
MKDRYFNGYYPGEEIESHMMTSLRYFNPSMNEDMFF